MKIILHGSKSLVVWAEISFYGDMSVAALNEILEIKETIFFQQ